MAKLGNTAQPSGARGVVGASGAAAGWRRQKVCRARRRIGEPTFHTLVLAGPGTVYMETPGAREIPRGGRLAVDYRPRGRERSTPILAEHSQKTLCRSRVAVRRWGDRIPSIAGDE
jgi:hypothetical protein